MSHLTLEQTNEQHVCALLDWDTKQCLHLVVVTLLCQVEQCVYQVQRTPEDAGRTRSSTIMQQQDR